MDNRDLGRMSQGHLRLSTASPNTNPFLDDDQETTPQIQQPPLNTTKDVSFSPFCCVLPIKHRDTTHSLSNTATSTQAREEMIYQGVYLKTTFVDSLQLEKAIVKTKLTAVP